MNDEPFDLDGCAERVVWMVVGVMLAIALAAIAEGVGLSL